MPSLASQTLAQRLKQQRERLQLVQKQQSKESSAPTAPTAERRAKRLRTQQTDEDGHKNTARHQRDDSSRRRAHKKQKAAVSEQQRQQREEITQRIQAKLPAAATKAAARPRPRSARPSKKPAQPTTTTDEDDDAQQEDDNDSDGEEEEEEEVVSEAAATNRSRAVTEPTKRIKNPQVYLDMSVNSQPIGRIVIELFQYASPRTVANFRALCTGERGVGTTGHPLHYLNSRVHRIDPSFAIQLGDITSGDGLGGDSIYGAPTFQHEPSHRRHTGFGTVSTSAALHSTAGASSTFFISTSHSPLRWLDKRHTVFGRVVRGNQVLLDIERLAGRRKGGAPKAEVTISGCGSFRKEQRVEEDEKRRQRHEVQVAKVRGKVGMVCPRCESGGKVNKKTRKGVRVWCTNEECKYCWYEAPNEWDEDKKAEFVVKEMKRRELEDEREREEEKKRAELEVERDDDDEDDEDEDDEDEEGREEDGEADGHNGEDVSDEEEDNEAQ